MMHSMSMKRMIVQADIKFFFTATPQFDAVVRAYIDVATVKKPMDIASEQQAIMDGVQAALSIRLDMGGFESRKRIFFGNRAGPSAGASKGFPEDLPSFAPRMVAQDSSSPYNRYLLGMLIIIMSQTPPDWQL